MAEFSILIPSIPERTAKAAALFNKLVAQADKKPVEVLMLTDNRSLPLSKKRNALLSLSAGRFIAHLDDDDDVSDDYVDSILAEIVRSPNINVICFDQIADLGDGKPYRVSTSLAHENQDSYLLPDGSRGDIVRKPWIWCAWNGSLARQTVFTSSSYGEDWVWLQDMLKKSRTEIRIPRVLHYYFWSKDTTAFQ